MQICVSSHSFSKWRKETNAEDLELCDQAIKLGFDGIEFTEFKVDDPIAHAIQIREYCRKIGLPIVSYTVCANLLSDDLKGEKEHLKRCVDTAAVKRLTTTMNATLKN